MPLPLLPPVLVPLYPHLQAPCGHRASGFQFLGQVSLGAPNPSSCLIMGFLDARGTGPASIPVMPWVPHTSASSSLAVLAGSQGQGRGAPHSCPVLPAPLSGSSQVRTMALSGQDACLPAVAPPDTCGLPGHLSASPQVLHHSSSQDISQHLCLSLSLQPAPWSHQLWSPSLLAWDRTHHRPRLSSPPGPSENLVTCSEAQRPCPAEVQRSLDRWPLATASSGSEKSKAPPSGAPVRSLLGGHIHWGEEKGCFLAFCFTITSSLSSHSPWEYEDHPDFQGSHSTAGRPTHRERVLDLQGVCRNRHGFKGNGNAEERSLPCEQRWVIRCVVCRVHMWGRGGAGMRGGWGAQARGTLELEQVVTKVDQP